LAYWTWSQPREKLAIFSEFANEEIKSEFYHNFDDRLLEVFGVLREEIVGPRYRRSVRIKGKKTLGG
jgi:hypothetical protein